LYQNEERLYQNAEKYNNLCCIFVADNFMCNYKSLKTMVLGTIGSILGAAGSVASGIMSSINNKKALQAQQAESARQQAYYEAKANEDPLSKASNQRLLNEYYRNAQKQLQAAQGVAAITGATPEYTLAVQKGIAEGRANVMSGISANGEASAEKAMEQAELARQQAAKAEQDRLAAKNQSYANLAANAANAASSMISGMQAKPTTQQPLVGNDGDEMKVTGTAKTGG
jgi:hypothetical protein